VDIEATPEDVGMSVGGIQRVARLVRHYVDERRYAGVVSVVARHDKVVHCDAYGNMDDERDKPMALDTIFRIWSMTKPIVSVALLTLYEEGRFQLDDPVAEFVPEFRDLTVFAGGTAEDYEVRPAARPMTVRDLLMHMSGIVGLGSPGVVGELYRRAGVGHAGSAGTLAETIGVLGTLPLATDPGSRWIYGMSTDVVGHLCEVLSGQPLDVFLQARVLGPLGMTATGFTVPAAKSARFAAEYGFAVGEPRYSLIDDPGVSDYRRSRSYLSGSAGLVGTAGDYLRFCRMLAGGGEVDGVRILGHRTVRFMTANHLPGGVDLAALGRDGGETGRHGQGFGLGFGVLLDPVVAQTLGTAGEYFWGGAASTAFFVNPVEDLIAIFLTQLRPSNSYPIRRALRAAVYSSIVR
jgi:CubicO group peptidase (beta-lactamase class C family)